MVFIGLVFVIEAGRIFSGNRSVPHLKGSTIKKTVRNVFKKLWSYMQVLHTGVHFIPRSGFVGGFSCLITFDY